VGGRKVEEKKNCIGSHSNLNWGGVGAETNTAGENEKLSQVLGFPEGTKTKSRLDRKTKLKNSPRKVEPFFL